MGEPKLLLRLGGETVIRRLLSVLQQSGIAATFVVVRPADSDLLDELERTSAHVVVPPDAPPDMRSSVQHALNEISRICRPKMNDAWMLIPADSPLLSDRAVQQTLDRWQDSAADVLVPTWCGQRGHPTLFRWRLAEDAASLPPNHGLNKLVRRSDIRTEEFPVDCASVVTDLDTPDDYRRAIDAVEGRPQ